MSFDDSITHCVHKVLNLDEFMTRAGSTKSEGMDPIVRQVFFQYVTCALFAQLIGQRNS